MQLSDAKLTYNSQIFPNIRKTIIRGTNHRVMGIVDSSVHFKSLYRFQFEKPGRREDFDYPDMAREAGTDHKVFELFELAETDSS